MLFIGMEYLQLSTSHLAEEWFLAAQQVNASDPLLLNELGVIAYNKNRRVVPASMGVTESLTLQSLGGNRLFHESDPNGKRYAGSRQCLGSDVVQPRPLVPYHRVSPYRQKNRRNNEN